jgi:hypothetical protein
MDLHNKIKRQHDGIAVLVSRTEHTSIFDNSNSPALDGTDWALPSRRRRVQLGDFMVAIATTAVGLAAISVPDVTSGERRIMGTVTLALIGLLWTQWGLASVASKRSWPGKSVILGIIASFLAMAMFVLLIILGLVFPQGAALLSVMLLLQVAHLTTWG